MKSAYFYFQRIKVTCGAKPSLWKTLKERTHLGEPKIMKPHKCPLVPKRCSEDLQRAVTGCTMAAESPARAQAQGACVSGGWFWSVDRRLADNGWYNRLLCMKSPAISTAFSHKGQCLMPSLGMHPRTQVHCQWMSPFGDYTRSFCWRNTGVL